MSFLLLIAHLALNSAVLMQVSCQELTSTLHSTEYGLKFAYNYEIVRFTCVTKGHSIAWSSDEYIGSGGSLLEFASIDREGIKHRAGQTVATLVNVSNVNGLTILESLLQISVRSAFQISSIRCHNLGNDTMNTISFGTNGNVSITCNKLSACPGETVRCTCITGYSNAIAWISDRLIGPNSARLEFVSVDPVQTPIQARGSNTSAVLTNVSSLNGVVVLSSDITFIVSHPANILTCLNVGQQSSYSIIVPMSSTSNCIPVSTTSLATTSAKTERATSTEIIHASSSSPRSDVIIEISAFLSVMTGLSIIAILILLMMIFYLRKRYTRVAFKFSNSDEDDRVSKHDTITDINNSEEAEAESESECIKQIKQVTTTPEKSTNAVSIGAELKVKPELHISHESRSPKSQQSKSEDGATGFVQLSEEESIKRNENEIIPDVEILALVAALDTQKQVLREVEEWNGKKKFVDTIMEDVFENTRNNSEDSTGGLRKRAAADKDSKEE